MARSSLQQTFDAALESLVDQIKGDRSILAAILCGSLSHDAVWEKSDIDLVLVTIDDQRVPAANVALCANGVNVHALLMPRTEFRKIAEGALANSFVHAFLAKGRVLYARDQSVADLCTRLREIGERDTQIQLLQALTAALPPIDKAHKWLMTRGDLDYTALWILYAATPLARVEVVGAHLVADREVIPQALALNRAFFQIVYSDLLNARKTRRQVQGALDAVDGYVADRAPRVLAPLIDHLRDAGEARAASEIESHFTRHFGVSGVTTACEYLAAQGLIGQAATPLRLTKRSNVDVQELAFFYIEPRRPARSTRATK